MSKDFVIWDKPESGSRDPRLRSKFRSYEDFYAFSKDAPEQQLSGRVKYTPKHLSYTETDPIERGKTKLLFGGSAVEHKDVYGMLKEMGANPKHRPAKVEISSIESETFDITQDTPVTKEKITREDVGSLKRIVKSRYPDATVMERRRRVPVRNTRTGEVTIRERVNKWSLRDKPSLKSVARRGVRALGIPGEIAGIGSMIPAARRAGKKKGPWMKRFGGFLEEVQGVKFKSPDVRKDLGNQI